MQYDKVPYNPTEALSRITFDSSSADSKTDSYQEYVNHCIERNIDPPRKAENLPVVNSTPNIISQKLNDPNNRWREFLLIEKLNPVAVVPSVATPGSVGYDLTSIQVGTIMPGQRQKISTGLAISVPHGHYGRIAPRSGLAVKFGIDTLAGVIDPDYQGEVCVILINHGESPFEYKIGDKIAQLILEKCSVIQIKAVASLKDHAGTTKRGAGGFGSTGTRV